MDALWASADGTNWQETLPPMPTSRYGAAAVNTGSSGGPECLVVAGGKKRPGEIIDTVEVLREGQWSTVQPLPRPRHYIFQDRHFVLHNGTIILGATEGRNWIRSLHSLLTKKASATPWKLTHRLIRYDGFTSFQGHLVCFDKEMLVYSPPNQAWVNIHEIPRQEMAILLCLASPAGSLIVLGWRYRQMIVQEVAFKGEHACT